MSGKRVSRTLASPRVIFSGIQPTGVPHVGNLLGALQQWRRLQDAAESSDRLLFCVVGLHAITLPQDPVKLRQERQDMLAALLAIGLDPQRVTLFHQEHVPEHAELAWILSCLTPVGHLRRMTTWKSRLAAARGAASEAEVDDSHLHLGLFSYPVLQAADVLLYKTTEVPVGEDQSQHIELTRDIARFFNKRYGQLFPEPRHVLTPQKRIASLRKPQVKMSKSDADPRSRILITDDADSIASKIRAAVTDSLGDVSYDPAKRPGVSNLLDLLAGLEGDGTATPQSLVARYAGKHSGALKGDLVEAATAALRPIRESFLRLQADPSYLDSVAATGRDAARETAARTMAEVRRRIGFDASP